MLAQKTAQIRTSGHACCVAAARGPGCAAAPQRLPPASVCLREQQRWTLRLFIYSCAWPGVRSSAAAPAARFRVSARAAALDPTPLHLQLRVARGAQQRRSACRPLPCVCASSSVGPYASSFTAARGPGCAAVPQRPPPASVRLREQQRWTLRLFIYSCVHEEAAAAPHAAARHRSTHHRTDRRRRRPSQLMCPCATD